jgi:hypothetical protein
VPLVVGRPEPSAEHPFLGLSLLGDPNVYCALYNRCSEQDEVARDQAFSTLTSRSRPARMCHGDAVAKAKQQLGNDIGTTRAIVVQGEVDYVTADMGVLDAQGKLIEFLIGEMYRAAHIRFETGSLHAESAEAIRLQHTELNEMLANLAAELQRVEIELRGSGSTGSCPGRPPTRPSTPRTSSSPTRASSSSRTCSRSCRSGPTRSSSISG